MGRLEERERRAGTRWDQDNPLDASHWNDSYLRPQRDLKTIEACPVLSPEDARNPEKQAESSPNACSQSAAIVDTAGQGKTEVGPSDAELEGAIVRAVTMGLGDVARTLAAQLDERRRARAGNVVTFDAERRKR